jgi:hypothetical protein
VLRGHAGRCSGLHGDGQLLGHRRRRRRRGRRHHPGELTDDPLENAFDSDDPVFQERGIQVLPLEAGLRYTFSPGSHFRPHLAGGASYFLLDSDFGEIDDELGYFAALGGTVGDDQGPQFFFEGVWRKATAQVRLDPEDLEDIDDVDVEDEAEFDIDGFGANLGIRWSF